jgi:hypothetical protein
VNCLVSLDGENLASIEVLNTAGWFKWVSFNTNVELSPGQHIIRFTPQNGNMNLNYFELSLKFPEYAQTFEAEDYDESGDTLESLDEQANIGQEFNSSDSFLSFDLNAPISGIYSLELLVKSNSDQEVIELLSNESLVESVQLPLSPEDFITVKQDLYIKAGEQKLKIRAALGEFTLDSLTITRDSLSTELSFDDRLGYTYSYTPLYLAEIDGIAPTWQLMKDDMEPLIISEQDGLSAILLEPNGDNSVRFSPNRQLFNKNILQIKLKTDEFMKRLFSIEVLTNQGKRTLTYQNYLDGNQSSNLVDTYNLTFDINMQQKLGEWYSFRRNLEQDLKSISSEFELIDILAVNFHEFNSFYINEISAFSYADEDGDLIPDEIEDRVQFNMHAYGDLDGDGISNIEQLLNGELDDQLNDNDGDGISNVDETNIYFTDINIAEFDGTIENLISINPAEPTAQLAQWATQENSIYAIDRRGSLEYTVQVDQAGIYRLKVLASQNMASSKYNSLNLQLYVDGQFVRRNTIDVSFSSDTASHYLTPHLTAGTHTIKLVYDNIYLNTALRINAIELGIPGGPDSDNDGTLDWVETHLQNSCTVETQGVSSKVSPMHLEGKGRYLRQMTLNSLPVQRASKNSWYSHIELDSESATSIDVSWENDSQSAQLSFTWEQTNLVYDSDTKLLVGSSLLLNAFALETDSAIITVDGQTHSVTPTSPVQHIFSEPGTYQISAMLNGQDSHSLNVEVVAVPTATSPYIWRNKERQWKWTDLNKDLFIEAPGMELLREAENFTLERSEILEDVNIIARIEEGGYIASVVPTKAFWLRDVAEGYVSTVEKFEDGSTHIQDTMFGVNLPTELEIEMSCFSGIVFEDGQASKILTKQDFDFKDEYQLNFYRDATRQGSICHRFHVYQDGTLVGTGHK